MAYFWALQYNSLTRRTMDGVWIGGEGVCMVSGAELTAARSAYDKATSLLSKSESRLGPVPQLLVGRRP
jgi:hypothetical protein